MVLGRASKQGRPEGAVTWAPALTPMPAPVSSAQASNTASSPGPRGLALAGQPLQSSATPVCPGPSALGPSFALPDPLVPQALCGALTVFLVPQAPQVTGLQLLQMLLVHRCSCGGEGGITRAQAYSPPTLTDSPPSLPTTCTHRHPVTQRPVYTCNHAQAGPHTPIHMRTETHGLTQSHSPMPASSHYHTCMSHIQAHTQMCKDIQRCLLTPACA